MGATTFFEIVFVAADFVHDARDAVEDPLAEALEEAGLGEVTGGGSGMGIVNVDVEVTDAERGLALIRRVLRDLGVAKSTVVNQYEPEKKVHPIYAEIPLPPDAQSAAERVPPSPPPEGGAPARSELRVDVMCDGALRLAGASIHEHELASSARAALARNPDLRVIVADERGAKMERVMRIVELLKAAGAKRVALAPGRSKR